MSWNPADAIAAARRTNGRITQDELAARLSELTGEKWTRDMVASLERGRKTFHVELLPFVVKALNTSLDYIVFGRGDAAKDAKGVSRSSFALVPVAA